MTASYQDSLGEPIFVEVGGGSAVRSHTSYESDVEAVCHHSGRYLTRAETFPQGIGLLREQHDFPGLPELDREFAKAAHAYEHQHLIWSRPGVRGVALLLGGLALFAGLVAVLQRRDQINGVLTTIGVVEFVVVYTLAAAGAIASLGLIAWGIWLLAQRHEIYHRQAAGQPPAVDDFPLLHCAYDIVAQERMRIDLGNALAQLHIEALPSELRVRLYPDPAGVVPLYQRYRQIYQPHHSGAYVHAGSIALEQLRAIDCGSLEYEHRLVLRAPAPAQLVQGSYTEGRLVDFSLPYKLRPHILFGWQDGSRLAPIECAPRLKADDSYTLELHLRWLGAGHLTCRLDECRLSSLPPELGPVRHVELGRYDVDRQEVIWRNLAFQRSTSPSNLGADRGPQSLVLSVAFSNPILHPDLLRNQPVIAGSYRCVLDGLISGMTISPDRIWNVLGRRASGEQSVINFEQVSVLDGRLDIDVRRLSQEHECVLDEQICYHSALEQGLVARILRVLVERCRVDVQRIEQALPRLDPAGTLRTQLNYWDLIGRQYDVSRLNGVDVHVVVSGYDHMVDAAPDAAHTRIDLRVRCLHDPRDREPEQRAAILLDTIAQQLRQELGVGIMP